MRRILWIAAVVLLFFCACTEEKGKPVNIPGLSFDTLTIDTTAMLLPDTISPKCAINISLQVAKGKNAGEINRAILSSAILMPGYVDTDIRKISPRQYLDTFACHYLSDYKRDYAPLYLDDTENATSYDDTYSVSTSTQMTSDSIIVYIAQVDHYGGGTHHTLQTLVRNIDVKMGKVLTLADIFGRGYEQHLHKELMKNLCKKFGASDAEGLARKQVLVDGKIYAPENFILYRNKIQFIYNPAEIAPHDIGEIRIDVSRKKIMNSE